MRFVVENPNPFLVTCNHGDSGGRRDRGLGEPMVTLTASRDAHGLVVPRLLRADQVAVFLNKHRGDSRGVGCLSPMPTITAGANVARPAGVVHALGLTAGHLTKHYSGAVGSPVDRPLGTITAVDHNALTSASLLRLRGTDRAGQAVAAPAPTLTSGGNHVGVVAAHLLHNTSGHAGGNMRSPVHTLTTGDHAAVVAAWAGRRPF